VILREQEYDTVIWATGAGSNLPFRAYNTEYFGSPVLAMQAIDDEGDEEPIYTIGPAAGIPFSDDEYALPVSNVDNNRVAMLRLGPKTAALAATLPSPRRF
jgi:hypothetical protein